MSVVGVINKKGAPTAIIAKETPHDTKSMLAELHRTY